MEAHTMTFERPKVFEPMFDKELLGHEDKEIVAIPVDDVCRYKNGNGTTVPCVYNGHNLCSSRSCGPISGPNGPQPGVVYLFKLEYMTAKLTSL